MNPALFDATVPAFTRALRALDACLDKAQAHAETVSFDITTLFSTRLAQNFYFHMTAPTTSCATTAC